MTPYELLSRIEALRDRTSGSLTETFNIIAALPNGDGELGPQATPTQILCAVRDELIEAAEGLEEVLDFFTARGDHEPEADKNSCAIRALRSLAGAKGGVSIPDPKPAPYVTEAIERQRARLFRAMSFVDVTQRACSEGSRRETLIASHELLNDIAEKLEMIGSFGSDESRDCDGKEAKR